LLASDIIEGVPAGLNRLRQEIEDRSRASLSIRQRGKRTR
jgi:hypothetical protein